MKGVAASEGFAVGQALVYAIDESVDGAPASDPEGELARFHSALEQAAESLRQVRAHAAEQIGEAEAQVFDAHLLMLQDPTLTDSVEQAIRSGASASGAVQHAVDEIAAMFAALPDEYFRAREADVRDVGQRLRRVLDGRPHMSLTDLQEPVVVIAHDLSPSDTATLRRDMVLGFATDAGSYTAHTAILARTLGIPAVVGLGDITQRVRAGDRVLLDGTSGEVTIAPTAAQIEAARSGQHAVTAIIHQRVTTLDGAGVELACNAGSLADVQAGVSNGADAVGLFRTEFLYLDRVDLPGEDEQYDTFRRAAVALGGRPLVIRTLDAGGDKALPGLPPVNEPNPFLGLRGIRLCLHRPELLVPQLRAALRAGAQADVRLMFPMVAFVEEVRQAKALLAECVADLDRAGVATGKIQVGIMVETPGAALLAERLAEEVDFFSLGTNDLVQYTLAVDRTNERTADLHQPLHPAILRLIGEVARAAHAHQRWVGVCGEMAAMPSAVPLLVGLGIDELSVSPPYVARTKARVSRLSRAACEVLAANALGCATAAEVEAAVRYSGGGA